MRWGIWIAAFSVMVPLAGARADGPDKIEAPVSAAMYDTVLKIAPSLAGVKINGGQNFDKAVTLGERDDGTVVITSMQVLGPGKFADVSVGTIAVVTVHYPGQCESPYGSDDTYTKAGGLPQFVVGASAKVWEIGRSNGTVWTRQVNSSTAFGPWEQYQEDPAKYVTYRC